MIVLPTSLDSAIGEGGTRLCFPHPDEPTRCVKVYRRRDQMDSPSLSRRLRMQLAGRVPWYNYSWHEMRVYKQLLAHPKASQLLPFFPVFDGIEATNYGPGLVVECVRDENGEISQSLTVWYRTASEAEREALLGVLDAFAELVIELALPIFDWGPQNVLVQKRGDGMQLKVIDFEGLAGNSELIPLANWIPALRRLKIRRRVERSRAALLTGRL